MVVRLEHPVKGIPSMVDTDSPMVISVMPVTPAKAYLLIVVTELGMVMEPVREV